MAFYLAQAAKACKNPAARSVYSASAFLRLSASSNRIPNVFSKLTAPYNYTPSLSSSLHFARYNSSVAFATKPQSTSQDTSTAVSDNNAQESISFDSLRGVLSEPLLKAISSMDISHLSPVQKEVLPLLPELARPYSEDEPAGSPPRDLLVKAKTGTGKTLAFLVPAIEQRLQAIEKHIEQAAGDVGKTGDAKFKRDIRYQYTKDTVGTLILSPTRELANQIAKEAMKLTSDVDRGTFGVRTFIGGEDKRNQLRQWRNGRRDIVVGTPGRIKDMLENEPDVRRGLESAQVFILDEADTLLEFGFRADIESIASHLPPSPQRQTFLFSATVSPQIRDIARATLDKKHKFINCVPVDEAPVHSHIPQYHTICPSPADQLPHVLRLIAHDQLTNPGKSKIMVFLPTTKMTQLFSTMLQELKADTLPAGRSTTIHEIHSKRNMDQRTRTSDRFRADNSGASILVSSDVSARGVDYPGVTRVIQVGISSTGDQYVHRVGRTGRGSSQVKGRGDLVLLDWEAGFVKPGGCLASMGVPLKGLTVSKLREEIDGLAKKFDENPNEFFEEAPAAESNAPTKKLGLGFRREREVRQSTPRGPVGLKQFQSSMEKAVAGTAIDESVNELKRTLDEEAVREVFMSQLGYYLGKADELSLDHRGGKNEIVEGLRKWTMEGCGLAVPPYVSQAFLEKLGLGRDRAPMRSSRGPPRQERRGGFGISSSKRSDYDGDRSGGGSGGGQRWQGRGSTQMRSGFNDRRPQTGYGGSARREGGEGGYRSGRSRRPRENSW